MASRVGQSRDVGGGQRLAPREARSPRVDPVGGRRSSDEVLPPGKELAPPPGGGSSACYPVHSQDGMARLNPKPGTELMLDCQGGVICVWLSALLTFPRLPAVVRWERLVGPPAPTSLSHDGVDDTDKCKSCCGFLSPCQWALFYTSRDGSK